MKVWAMPVGQEVTPTRNFVAIASAGFTNGIATGVVTGFGAKASSTSGVLRMRFGRLVTWTLPARCVLSSVIRRTGSLSGTSCTMATNSPRSLASASSAEIAMRVSGSPLGKSMKVDRVFILVFQRGWMLMAVRRLRISSGSGKLAGDVFERGPGENTRQPGAFAGCLFAGQTREETG